MRDLEMLLTLYRTVKCAMSPDCRRGAVPLRVLLISLLKAFRKSRLVHRHFAHEGHAQDGDHILQELGRRHFLIQRQAIRGGPGGSLRSGRPRPVEPWQRFLFSDSVGTDHSHDREARNLEGRFAQAREVSQQMAAEHPNMIAPQQMIGATYIEEGHPELALPIFRQLKQRFPQAQFFEAMACAAAGQREEALRLIRPFEEKYPDPSVSMQWFALVYAFMGDEPNTVKWLERSVDRHEWQALSVAVHPAYAAMRSSPGFRALKKRMGLE